LILFSIITINFNNAKGLKKTFESVVCQSYSSLEFIVIDGGSKDGSKEYIESNDNYIDYWVSESDRGIYHAMNKGLNVATGDYCFFLNSGDFFYDKHVLESVAKNINPNSGMVYGLISWEETNQLWNPKRDLKSFEMAFHTLIPHQATFFKTEMIKKLGGFKEEFRVVSDWALMLNILEKKYKTQKIDLIISVCENQGVSAKLAHLIRRERYTYLIKYNFIILLKAYLFSLKSYIRRK